MRQLLGVRFSEHGQVQACVHECGENELLACGKGVMAELDYGRSYGLIIWQRALGDDEEVDLEQILTPQPSQDEAQNAPPRSLAPVRPATAEEITRAEENMRLAKDARLFCRERIQARELEMKLVDVETLHDRSKMIFYFTAPTRIDFRELVKDLVRQYHTRIELRQIGVRHETQMIGALGNCGGTCCCRRYLRKFAPVTIKMAKEQNLFLNPAKISGVCGRLLCCLSFEQNNYDEFHRGCPKLGKRYQTDIGPLRTLRGNMFRNSVIVLPDGGPEQEYSLEEWSTLHPCRAENRPAQPQREKNSQQATHNNQPKAAASNFQDKDAILEEAEAPDQDNKGKRRRRKGPRPQAEGDQISKPQPE